MLTPEAAKVQLEKWKQASEDDDVESNLLAKARALPAQIRPIGFALVDRDADGNEIAADASANRVRQQFQRLAELSDMPVADRLGFFAHFAPQLATPIETGWQLLKQGPYQTGYTRKSFRAPRNPERTLGARSGWLWHVLHICCRYRDGVVTAPWLAAWAAHIDATYGDQDVIGRLLAGAIDAGGLVADEVFDILTQSARNEHEIGGMGRHVTRALLMASRPEGWEFVERLLLAAQRQEGLRQTILETVDEAHPQAFRRMLRLIIDHDLARFSAVVRALNLWLGYSWDSQSTKLIHGIIEKVLRFLEDVASCEGALNGKDAEDVFLALWSVAFQDAFAALPHVERLLGHDKVEHRFVAVVHLGQLDLAKGEERRLRAIDDADVRVAMRALAGRTADSEREGLELGDEDDLFERLERLYSRLPEKATLAKPLVWPWASTKLGREFVTTHMLGALGKRPPTRLIPYLSGCSMWHRKAIVGYLSEQEKWDQLTRDTLLDLAGDHSSDVRQAAYAALAKLPLQSGDAEKLERYLTRKTSDLRRGVISLLAKQTDADGYQSAERLLASSDANQRLAGLELLRQLAESNRDRQRCQNRALAYRGERKKLTKEEEVQLTAIAESGRETLTLDNGLGLFDTRDRTPVIPPVKHDVQFMTDAAVACLKSLDELVHELGETPVRIEKYSGVEENLLGNVQYGFPSPDWDVAPENCKQVLLLRERWEQWKTQRPDAHRDSDGLELVRAHAWAHLSTWECRGWIEWAKSSSAHRAIADSLSGKQKPVQLRYSGVVWAILNGLLYYEPPENVLDRLLDILETAYATLPAEMHHALVEIANKDFEDWRTQSDQKEGVLDWRRGEPIRFWRQVIDWYFNLATAVPNHVQRARYWQLQHWADEPVPGARRKRPGLGELQGAYAAGAASTTDWYDHLLGPRAINRWGTGWCFEDLNLVTRLARHKLTEQFLSRHPEIREVIDRCRDGILQVELERGEAATCATRPALELGALYGTDNLLRISSKLGKAGFRVESYWNYDRRIGKEATLTTLASTTYPEPNDTPQDFASEFRAAVANGQIAEGQMLQLAFLAPQWTRHIEAYLGWPGFTEGLYWFLAHMKNASDAKERAGVGAEIGAEAPASSEDDKDKPSSWDRLIMERTPLTAEERSDGAVDVAWFQRIYAQLKPKQWQAMAEAARFAATPQQAKFAQLVADVLRGTASRKELIRGINAKKLKDNVRLLGLLPLATGSKRDADLTERYKVLQEYRRYAKQLSAMTKDSAMRAVEIGMQNLARTAGYADPLRLEWAMEADSVKDLARGSVSVSKDGVTVTLTLDDQSQPILTVMRGTKELKSLPPTIKKDRKVAALTGRVGDLKRQASRMRESLESAMCRGDTFSGAELAQICTHAVLAPLVQRLIFVGDGIMGYPDKKGRALRDHRNKLEPVKKNESLRIAHPCDLLATGKWESWQHECFHFERVQPFKQVFRELYVVTKQEKADRTLSRRYSGQQVNPQQACALWGRRGWSTKDGVWKAFHDVGLVASVNFNHGITTPLEVEGLTLDTITFYRRGASGEVKLVDVPPRIFSETMRDLDLVVSVAHRGGVDPEATASTVEMRESLLRETCQFLTLKNVRFKNAHALVDGELGKYSVHLGSATVHKLPGGALCIVPVHAQHRGRLFLPFVDDDPKTAEVISKVLLLAKDSEIQDPIILDQLRRM